jgi:Lon protease-like protein
MSGAMERASNRPDGGGTIPLFPLNTLLFPDGSLGLQIFEVRYLDLIGKCYKNGTPFGVVTLLQGQEVRQRDPARPTGAAFAQEVFADVGTLAHITEWAVPQAGLMVIRCSGGARFHIRSRKQLTHGLWVAEVDPLAPDQPMPIPPDLQPYANALARLLAPDSPSPLELPPIEQPWRLDDCGWVANRWCELLAMPSAQKQSLLQLDSPLLRLELVGDLLTQRSMP